jgi:hypothetical protein
MIPVGIMAEAGGVRASGMVPMPCGGLLALAAANEAAGRLYDARRVLGQCWPRSRTNAQMHKSACAASLSAVAFRHGWQQRAPA